MIGTAMSLGLATTMDMSGKALSEEITIEDRLAEADPDVFQQKLAETGRPDDWGLPAEWKDELLNDVELTEELRQEVRIEAEQAAKDVTDGYPGGSE